MLNTRAIANFGHHGDGHGAWHTAPGLQRLDTGCKRQAFT
jgi:hypothetical protein